MTRTTTLFSDPSFLRGMSSLLDIGSTLTIYNESDTPQEADAKALYMDWAAVGDDLIYAMNRWDEENVS